MCLRGVVKQGPSLQTEPIWVLDCIWVLWLPAVVVCTPILWADCVGCFSWVVSLLAAAAGGGHNHGCIMLRRLVPACLCGFSALVHVSGQAWLWVMPAGLLDLVCFPPAFALRFWWCAWCCCHIGRAHDVCTLVAAM